MTNKLFVDLDALTAKFREKLDEALGKLDKFSSTAKKTGGILSATVTVPLVALGVAGVKAASDLQESQNKIDVAFKNSADAVSRFTDTTVNKFGIAKGTAMDMAALFGDMATGMGLTTEEAASMSTSLVGLAGDMASFKNVKLEVAQTALNSIFTGETESLKMLGVVMTEANLKAFALDKGLNANIQSMSQAEKIALRYAFVMDATKNAHGDYANTADGAANLTRTFSERIKELTADFGSRLLPIYEKVMTAGNKILKYFSELDDTTKNLIVTVGVFAAAIGPALIALGSINALLPVIATGFAALMSPLGLTIITLGALTVAWLKYGDTVEYQMARIDNVLAKADRAFESFLGGNTSEMDKRIKQNDALIKSFERTAQAANLPKLQTNEDGSIKTKNQMIGETFAAINPQEKVETTSPLAGLSGVGQKIKDFTKEHEAGILKYRLMLQNGLDFSNFKNMFSGVESMSGKGAGMGVTDLFADMFDPDAIQANFDERFQKIAAGIGDKAYWLQEQIEENINKIKDKIKPFIEVGIGGLANIMATGVASIFNQDVKFDWKQMVGQILSSMGDMFIAMATPLISAWALATTVTSGVTAPKLGAALGLLGAGIAMKGGGMALSTNSNGMISGGSSPRGGMTGDFGMSSMKVQVVGNLVADGTQLKAVINNVNNQYGI